MNKENRSALDRELFSELIESPIHPFLINMVRPYVDSCDPKFRLQINGEALWHWREVRGQPRDKSRHIEISPTPGQQYTVCVRVPGSSEHDPTRAVLKFWKHKR